HVHRAAAERERADRRQRRTRGRSDGPVAERERGRAEEVRDVKIGAALELDVRLASIRRARRHEAQNERAAREGRSTPQHGPSNTKNPTAAKNQGYPRPARGAGSRGPRALGPAGPLAVAFEVARHELGNAFDQPIAAEEVGPLQNRGLSERI